ncbi:acyltransferase [Acidicapsa acidisoli]|uniref:acyltransferase n=1 Tax=Acidicapsa acidisoli TaxID=1615681 RepID=UPI0021E0B466|nr:acyltransferase [Acidicapsa acidisoli]
MIRGLIRRIAFRTGRLHGLYLRICRPLGDEYARFLRARKTFQSQGEFCYIMPTSVFTDPKYVEIGNNVQMATCTVFGHDGSVAMLNRAYGVILDSVGPVRLKDNVFIGHNAIVMPNVTIGPNAIVAAGALVTRDVPEGKIVSGVPAKVVGSVETLVAFRESQTRDLPWVELLMARGVSGYDPQFEPELQARRIAHFFRR